MAQPLRLAALLAFLAFPILEIGLLIRAGQAFGFWRLALLVVVTAMLGSAVIRRTGLAVLTRARAHIERGRSGFAPMFDGLIHITAGMLLIFPGLISDVIGLILLIPAVRNVLVTSVLPKFVTATVFTSRPNQGPFHRPADDHSDQADPAGGDAVTIEGEYERVSEETIDQQRSLKPRGGRRSAN